MKNLYKMVLAGCFTAAFSTTAWADFNDFAIQVDNSAGTLLTAEEQVQGTEFKFGVAVGADGAISRVAVDDASSVATVSGKYHNDHGSVNLKVVVPVDGTTKVSVGTCSYYGGKYVITDAQGNKIEKAPGQGCWKNDHSLITELYYVGDATTLTIDCASYTPYIKVEASDYVPQKYTVSYAKGEGEGLAPGDVEWTQGDPEVVLPKNFTLYKEGYTLTGWSDGTKTYAPGSKYEPTGDATLTAVYAENEVSLAQRSTDVVLKWDFQRNNGAPTLSLQGAGKTGNYVTQALVNGKLIDVALAYDATNGKIANGNWGDWCQMNGGTKFTLPSCKDAVVSLESYSPTTTTTINGVAASANTENTYSYKVAAEGETAEIVIGDGSYFRYIQCVLPAIKGEGNGYDNVFTTFSWAVGNEKNATAAAAADAVSESSVSVGTDLSVTSTSATYALAAEGTVGPYVTYQPTTSNAGCVAGDMIEYKVKMKKGVTFTPASVEFDAIKEGTDNAYFSWSYTVDGVESDIVAYSDPKTQIRRNNDANPSSPLTHKETITADAGREFTLRFYISDVANNKKMSIGNVKINGSVNGEEEVRAFQNFKVDFRNADGMTVLEPAALPAGVEINGTFHDGQHGNNTTTITVPVDGPVKFTFGSCQYGATTATIADSEGNQLATVDCNAGCDSNTSYDHFVTWNYNSEEPKTLVITTASYIPFFYAEACELLPMVDVVYYDTNGKLIGKETVQGGSGVKFIYNESDVTIADGYKFRGWFTSDQQTALKIAEGYTLQDDLKLYARATKVEDVTSTSRYEYDLTKQYFYVEDHEAIEIDGKYYNNHGWLVDKDGAIRVKVSEKAYVTVGNCLYSAESTAVVTNEAGEQVAEFPVKADSDGATTTFFYNGTPGWLSITFPAGSYTHSVSVWNVVEELEYDEEHNLYVVNSGDVSSFLLALKDASAHEGAKIFLPNGTYDLGTTVLTPVSGKNISIIGESMKGTIIKNAPPKETEGIGTTATLLNTSDGLYMQDLTIQNAMTFDGGTGRAVCLQDKGKNTICKNVALLSYQDTYYSNAASRFYWEDCEIHGVVDYVCGDGDVVYNRTKFVNESIKNTTIAAPYTSASCKWGYVMLDCEIETLCDNFNLGRSWGGESKLQYIRCKDLNNKLVSSRWTIAGMNVAAYQFKEYGMMNKDGNITTPASNVVEFTHSSGNKKYETVLSADEAAQYTVANIYGEWAPDVTCAQVTEIADGQLYLINGKITTVIPAEGGVVRIANARGGFGPEVTVAAVKNTLLTAGAYTVTGKVEAKYAVADEVFAKYLENDGNYSATATLTGDEDELVITTAEGLLNGFSIKGDAVLYSPANTFSVAGDAANRKFSVAAVENGEVKATEGSIALKGDAKEVLVDGVCGILYNGTLVGTVSDIKLVPQFEPTSINTVTTAVSRNGKFLDGGKLIIVRDGKAYNVAGVNVR